MVHEFCYRTDLSPKFSVLSQTIKEMERSVHYLYARLLNIEVSTTTSSSIKIDSTDLQSDLAITYQLDHLRGSLQANQASVLHQPNNDGNSHYNYLQQEFCLFEQELHRIEPV